MIIKVCGMREGDNIRALAESRTADWMGMIFYSKSLRYVSNIPTFLPRDMRTIGVFVDPTLDEIAGRLRSYSLGGIQLHGHETPRFIVKLRRFIAENAQDNSTLNIFASAFNTLPECSKGTVKQVTPTPEENFADVPLQIPVIIKAFSISKEEDLAQTAAYEEVCDYFLFDTPCLTAGGSGKRFDWSLLKAYSGKTPFLLSGGIGPDCLQALHTFYHPKWIGIDLNSRFETAPALKDIQLLTEFCKEFKELHYDK